MSPDFGQLLGKLRKKDKPPTPLETSWDNALLSVDIPNKRHQYRARIVLSDHSPIEGILVIHFISRTVMSFLIPVRTKITPNGNDIFQTIERDNGSVEKWSDVNPNLDDGERVGGFLFTHDDTKNGFFLNLRYYSNYFETRNKKRENNPKAAISTWDNAFNEEFGKEEFGWTFEPVDAQDLI